MNDLFRTLEFTLEFNVIYLAVSILLHVSLQTLVNHFHRMRADQEHTKQLNAIDARLLEYNIRLEAREKAEELKRS